MKPVWLEQDHLHPTMSWSVSKNTRIHGAVPLPPAWLRSRRKAEKYNWVIKCQTSTMTQLRWRESNVVVECVFQCGGGEVHWFSLHYCLLPRKREANERNRHPWALQKPFLLQDRNKHIQASVHEACFQTGLSLTDCNSDLNPRQDVLILLHPANSRSPAERIGLLHWCEKYTVYVHNSVKQ